MKCDIHVIENGKVSLFLNILKHTECTWAVIITKAGSEPNPGQYYWGSPHTEPSDL